MKRITISAATHEALKDYSFRVHRRFITEQGVTRVDKDNVNIEVDEDVYARLKELADDPEDAIKIALLGGKLS